SFSTRNWHPSVQVAALVVTAFVLGWMIASEHWLFIAGVFALLLLLVRPIEVALGLYAFLIPFESMTTLDNGTGPTPTLLMSVGGVLSSRTWSRRTLFLTGTGVIAFAVFLTMSRGALAAVAGITFIFLLRLRLNWRLLLPVAAAFTALMFMPRLFFERMHEV